MASGGKWCCYAKVTNDCIVGNIMSILNTAFLANAQLLLAQSILNSEV
jgi:hypothetical protein